MKGLLDFEILTKTFDDLPVGVGIFHVGDLDDNESIRYVFMNKVLLYEMRKEKDEVFGKRIIEVAPEAYQHEVGLQVIDTYRRVAVDKETVNLGLVEYSNHMVAGIYECSVHHIQDNYVYVMLRNVTELEQARMELERKNKELKEFAYIVSHDLNEPLYTISSLVELMKDQYLGKLNEDADQILSFIFDSSHRMRKVIQDLLDYSSLDKQKEKVIVDTQELLELIKQDLHAKIKDTKTVVEVGDLPSLQGFYTELRLLFQNLISNGIKFNRPDLSPVIKISAKEEKDAWTFSIADNGIGIAEEHQDKIFSIFQRLHDRTEYEGTGIGLAHCKKIVDLHSGKIWVESIPGEGSTFYFTLPK